MAALHAQTQHASVLRLTPFGRRRTPFSARITRRALSDDATSEATADPRRLLARAVADSLDGGKAAMLTPPRRRRILHLAKILGVRDFDAHLIIAIVQDATRRGESIEDSRTTDRLDMLHRPEPPRGLPRVLVQAAAAVAIAAVMLSAMVTLVLTA